MKVLFYRTEGTVTATFCRREGTRGCQAAIVEIVQGSLLDLKIDVSTSWSVYVGHCWTHQGVHTSHIQEVEDCTIPARLLFFGPAPSPTVAARLQRDAGIGRTDAAAGHRLAPRSISSNAMSATEERNRYQISHAGEIVKNIACSWEIPEYQNLYR